MMRRTPFRRASASTRSETEQEREQRLMDKARRAMNSVVPRAATMGLGTTAAAPIPKAVRRELEPVWAADTMRRLWEMGLIPDSLRNQVETHIDKAQ